jgi:ATP-dependent protease ClpP protease subunit
MVKVMSGQYYQPVNRLLEEIKLGDYKNKNTLYIDDEITTEFIITLSRQLKKLAEKQLSLNREDRTPIKLIIASPGGSLVDGMHFCDLMEYYINKGIEIHTYCTSYAYSMAFKILICGSKRFAYKRSDLMCHQWNRFKYGQETYQDTVNDREQCDRWYNLIVDLITEKTNITAEQFNGYTKSNKDFYMDSVTALDLNVIDEIII